MTKIQQETIPHILKGEDLLAQSKTGSGKTLAFAIPLIIDTDTTIHTPHTLIIAPTRELVQQIAAEMKKVGSYKSNLKIVTLYGGTPLRTQADSLAKGSHILIGTPGRIIDHLGKGTLILDTIKKVVLDEADKMLDMGFYDDIMRIDSHIPSKEQSLLFSATFPSKVESLANQVLKNPFKIKIDDVDEERTIDQIAYACTDKFQALVKILQSYRPNSLLVFCNTKEQVITLTKALQELGHTATDLQGNLDQNKRDEAIIRFSNGTAPALVATDVASRGLDIKEIEMIINYDLPFDQETYTHRIGRTGRAGAAGIALSLYTPDEKSKCAYITQHTRTESLDTLKYDDSFTMTSAYLTLCLGGGKKNKLRKGDILGTFCKEIGIDNTLIGQIDMTQNYTYIALHKTIIKKVLDALRKVKIKKKKYPAWILD